MQGAPDSDLAVGGSWRGRTFAEACGIVGCAAGGIATTVKNQMQRRMENDVETKNLLQGFAFLGGG